jgi:hypothetical protein
MKYSRKISLKGIIKKLLLKFYYSVGVYSVAAFPHRPIGQGHIEQTWTFYLTKC